MCSNFYFSLAAKVKLWLGSIRNWTWTEFFWQRNQLKIFRNASYSIRISIQSSLCLQTQGNWAVPWNKLHQNKRLPWKLLNPWSERSFRTKLLKEDYFLRMPYEKIDSIQKFCTMWGKFSWISGHSPLKCA